LLLRSFVVAILVGALAQTAIGQPTSMTESARWARGSLQVVDNIGTMQSNVDTAMAAFIQRRLGELTQADFLHSVEIEQTDLALDKDMAVFSTQLMDQQPANIEANLQPFIGLIGSLDQQITTLNKTSAGFLAKLKMHSFGDDAGYAEIRSDYVELLLRYHEIRRLSRQVEISMFKSETHPQRWQALVNLHISDAIIFGNALGFVVGFSDTAKLRERLIGKLQSSNENLADALISARTHTAETIADLEASSARQRAISKSIQDEFGDGYKEPEIEGFSEKSIRTYQALDAYWDNADLYLAELQTLEMATREDNYDLYQEIIQRIRN